MPDDAWVAFGLSILTSIIIFVRRMLLFARFRRPLCYYHVVAFGLSLLSGVLFWVTIQSVERHIALQICSGLLGTVTAWTIMVLLVNGGAYLPSFQQTMSLGFYMLTEFSVLMQVRILLKRSS